MEWHFAGHESTNSTSQLCHSQVLSNSILWTTRWPSNPSTYKRWANTLSSSTSPLTAIEIFDSKRLLLWRSCHVRCKLSQQSKLMIKLTTYLRMSAWLSCHSSSSHLLAHMMWLTLSNWWAHLSATCLTSSGQPMKESCRSRARTLTTWTSTWSALWAQLRIRLTLPFLLCLKTGHNSLYSLIMAALRTSLSRLHSRSTRTTSLF